MKFLIVLFISIFPSLIFAQNYRFTYEYSFVPEKEKKDSVIIDYMNLDTNGKESLFFNDSKYRIDSAFSISKSLNELTQFKNYNQNLNYKIHKDYNNQKIDFYSRKFNLDLVIEEKDLPKWTLINEFLKINTLNCQKAYTKYKGREWVAWFTTDIPISDGPYKFIGLPGLIVRIKDSMENHKFDLIQIINIKQPFLEIPKKAKAMTQSQYNKLANRKFNIKKDITFTNVTNSTVTVGLNHGTVMNITNTKGINIDQIIEEKVRSSNNPLEIE